MNQEMEFELPVDNNVTNVLNGTVDDEKKEKKKRVKKTSKKRVKEVVEDGEEVPPTKKSKKPRKKTLKNMYEGVKPPRSAFQLYLSAKSKENRDAVAKATSDGNPTDERLSLPEITRLWKTVGEEVKVEYQKLANEDLLRFLKEIHDEKNHQFTPKEQEKYRKELISLGIEINTKEENRKLMKKRPTSAFLFYLNANRERVIKEEGVTNEEAMKILGKRWREELTESDKEPWNKRAQMEIEEMANAA